jgi:hypothetical protein
MNTFFKDLMRGFETTNDFAWKNLCALFQNEIFIYFFFTGAVMISLICLANYYDGKKND